VRKTQKKDLKLNLVVSLFSVTSNAQPAAASPATRRRVPLPLYGAGVAHQSLRDGGPARG